MEVISDPLNFTSFSGDWEGSNKVGFRALDETTAEIRSYSKEWDMETNARLEADKSGYWLYSDDIVVGYCERFTRKDPDEPSAAEQPATRPLSK